MTALLRYLPLIIIGALVLLLFFTGYLKAQIGRASCRERVLIQV